VSSTAVETYQAIIDELVEETSQSIGDRLIREEGIYARAPGYDAHNTFIASLTSEQRELVAEMLRKERTSTIHDVLAGLTWWLLCGEVGLTFQGRPMPFDLSGMGLHGDYVGRCQGWQWPDEPEQLQPSP
jgi:hypothetical protein